MHTTTINTLEIKAGSIIEYELHGKPIIAACLSEHNSKWSVLNEFDESYSLKQDRIYLIKESQSIPKVTDLKNISKEIKEKFSSFTINKMEELWNKVETPEEEISLDKLSILLSENIDPIEKAALRRALNKDSIYFRRSALGYKKRSEEEVSNGKDNQKNKALEESSKLILKLSLEKRLSGDLKTQLPQEISYLEEVSALGKKAKKYKLLEDLIEHLSKKIGLNHKTSTEEKAFTILLKANHFSKYQNLSPIKLGRPVVFSSKEREEAEEIFRSSKLNEYKNRKDITNLFLFTIDSDSTLDFDDALSIEKVGESFEIGVHITDVGEYINEDKELYKAALRRGTSTYCPDEVIPMLPNSLSEGVFSLKEGVKRAGLSFFFLVNNGLLVSNRIESTIIKVSKRFSYEDIDELLFDDSTNTPSNKKPVVLDEKIKTIFPELIRELWDICSNQELLRLEQGAILFNRRDLVPAYDGKKITLETNSDDSPSRKIVSELMIAANNYASEYAAKNNIPFLYRTQNSPDTDIEEATKNIPEGPAREYAKRGFLKKSNVSLIPSIHAGLGLNYYSQITSPIRRFLDYILLTQIRVHIESSEIKYNDDFLTELLTKLQLGLDEANIIQKERNRFWLLKYIEQEKLFNLEGIVVRNDGARPLAEIDNLYCLFPFNPISKENPKLGERVKLKITKLDPIREKIYIDQVPNE